MPTDAALARALALVRDLRARCPWDGAQTPDTLRPYLVEEVLELDQAIADGAPERRRDELGDLLLHIAFQLVIAEERREFDAEGVTRALEEKMWRRHPHLFAGADRPASWEAVKRRERAPGAGTLQGIPRTLPPLLMAYRLQERAAGVGFDWPDAAGPLAKVKEETAELEREMGAADHAAATRELGDLLFAAVNLARKLGIDPRAALEGANAKFVRRFEQVERRAAAGGMELGRATLAELDRLWDEIKVGESE